jgi:hypothetical protein
MGTTGVERAQAPPPTGWSTAGTVAAYAAAIVAFAYALVSLYWAVGGHGPVSTVGGYVEQFARHGGTLPVLVALSVRHHTRESHSQSQQRPASGDNQPR